MLLNKNRTKYLHFSDGGVGIVATTLGDEIELVFAREDASTDGVIGIESNVIELEAGQEFILDGAGDGVVVSLVDAWEDVSVLLAEFADLCYIPGRVV